jgi:hypothetical protein
MNSALESTLAVGDLRLVLAVVLVSGGGGGEGEASAGRGLSSTGKATSSGRSTTGGTSGGGEKYGPSSYAATTVGKLGAERRRSPQAPPRPIGEV